MSQQQVPETFIKKWIVCSDDPNKTPDTDPTSRDPYFEALTDAFVATGDAYDISFASGHFSGHKLELDLFFPATEEGRGRAEELLLRLNEVLHNNGAMLSDKEPITRGFAPEARKLEM